MQSSVQSIKLVQPLRQCLGIFLIYHVPGVSDDLQLRPPDVSGQKAGRFQVRAVLFPAEDEGGAPDLPQPTAEIQVLHGVPQGKGVPLVKGHGRESGLGQKPEHYVLEGKGELGDLVGRADEHQGLDVLRVVQGIVQGQDAPQGEAAQVDWPAGLGAVLLEGGTDVGKAGLPPV